MIRKTLVLGFFIFNGIISNGQMISHKDNYVLIDGYLYGNRIENSDKGTSVENRIYKPESIFTFNYKYIDNAGKEMFFIINNYGTWDFVETNQNEGNIIKDFKMEILNRNLRYNNPSFYQKGISFIIDKNITTTGLIENELNIWLHPPREYLFKILELNPFPYIKSPIEIGHTWEWKLKIGGQWGDKRWKEWTGNIENKYQYRIVGIEKLKTTLGTLDCYIVESQAVSELGITKLKSYFNERYGFVRLEYTNIDNSKIEMNLQNIQMQMIKFFKNSL
jgi:hypothetical protein